MHQLQRSRTLFLSDLHLATRACRAQVLLDFLQHNDAETIYLVGDVIDFWRVKRGAPWPPTHNEVVQTHFAQDAQRLKGRADSGNHDEGSREFCGTALDGIEVLHERAYDR
jgi:UDP-2,3-diacylglucosamine pyrophosphatase LpxH